MANFNVRLTGLNKVIALANRGDGLGPVIQRAIFAEATTVLNESKRIVPVATGNLRASGKVENPKQLGTKYSVEVTYGGAAAPYALFVHEIPPNSGGRWGTGNAHKPGKTFKFLEIPANAHRDKFVNNVKARIVDYLRRSR